MVHVMECFLSIQGEGSRTGRPSIFVRTGLCNLNCPGFNVEYKDPKTNEIKYGCDSYYSVNPGFKENWKAYIDYEELVDDILKQMPNLGRNMIKPDIVFTGGEPLIYWNDEITEQWVLAELESGITGKFILRC